MKNILTTTFTLLFPLILGAQSLSQSIRGTVRDLDNQLPLIGAEILIVDQQSYLGTTTDLEGKFSLDDVALGRTTIQVSYLGYETKVIPNIVVNSAKEVILNLVLEERAETLDDIVIMALKQKGEAINDMALISSRSISAEETNRYAGGFNDPSRIMSNFAGVTTTHDGGNDIIVRGNSPKYIQWQLEGMQISNPNHFGDQSGVGGAISTLNNNLLANSDFHAGAFAPEYGDVLSGVYDVKMRAGNNEQTECVFGFGLLGTDLTVEGPLRKNYGGSFIANYRYSTASLINELGLLGDISGIPKFQDAAFKLLLPTKKSGVFSFFGLAGKSSFLFEDVTPAVWVTPGDLEQNQREDYSKSAYLFNLGMNHTLSLSDKSYLKTTLSYSNEEVADDIFEKEVIATFDEEGIFLRDSLIGTVDNFKGKLQKNSYRAALNYNYKFNSKHKIQLGTKYIHSNQVSKQSQLDAEDRRVSLVDFDEGIGSFRNFISWKYKPTDELTIVAGVQNMNVLLNKQSTIEPRVAASWQLTNSSSFNIGFGQHSNMESIHHYFTQLESADDNTTRPNIDLGLLKARHLVAGYEKRVGQNLRAKLEVYYQDLYNLPVENSPTSFYSTINEGLEFRYLDLVNEGKGKNYGIEFTLEKFFDKSYYYLINASVYQSKYTALDGIERNTKYNGNYLINFLAGKEFDRLGKKANQTLNLNVKAFIGGGKKIIPLLKDEAGQAYIDTENDSHWDYDKAYTDKIEDIHLVVLSASYKWNKPKATHELFLNIDNITNTMGRIDEFYDEREPDNIGYTTQFGIFPNLMYRVYF